MRVYFLLGVLMAVLTFSMMINVYSNYVGPVLQRTAELLEIPE